MLGNYVLIKFSKRSCLIKSNISNSFNNKQERGDEMRGFINDQLVIFHWSVSNGSAGRDGSQRRGVPTESYRVRNDSRQTLKKGENDVSNFLLLPPGSTHFISSIRLTRANRTIFQYRQRIARSLYKQIIW